MAKDLRTISILSGRSAEEDAAELERIKANEDAKSKAKSARAKTVGQHFQEVAMDAARWIRSYNDNGTRHISVLKADNGIVLTVSRARKPGAVPGEMHQLVLTIEEVALLKVAIDAVVEEK